jgi:hypothetical protein
VSISPLTLLRCKLAVPLLRKQTKGLEMVGHKPASARMNTGRKNNAVKYSMWACCAVLLAGVLGLIAAGDGLGGVSGPLVALVVALCFGSHIVLHRLMGKLPPKSDAATSGQAATPETPEHDGKAHR